jgi:hypothetical protein
MKLWQTVVVASETAAVTGGAVVASIDRSAAPPSVTNTTTETTTVDDTPGDFNTGYVLDYEAPEAPEGTVSRGTGSRTTTWTYRSNYEPYDSDWFEEWQREQELGEQQEAIEDLEREQDRQQQEFEAQLEEMEREQEQAERCVDYPDMVGC